MPLRGEENRSSSGNDSTTRKRISQVKLSHPLTATSVVFDDPNLVSSAGLVPVPAG
jgi:hypothetical protein